MAEHVELYLAEHQLPDGTHTRRTLSTAASLLKHNMRLNGGPHDWDALLQHHGLFSTDPYEYLYGLVNLATLLGIHVGPLEHTPLPGFENP